MKKYRIFYIYFFRLTTMFVINLKKLINLIIKERNNG